MRNKKLLPACLVTMLMFTFVFALGCAPTSGSDTQDNTAIENESSNSAGNDEVAMVDFTWSADTDCGICHATEVESQADAAYLLATHTTASCSTCHSDASTLTTSHEGATAQGAARAGLKETEVPEETCVTCHNKAEIASITSESVVLTDSNGSVVNPHELPQSAKHESLDCNSCHQMHVADADLEKKAQRACGSCHHANVYECYTCHP